MWIHVVITLFTALAVIWIRFRRSRYYQLLSAIPSPKGLPLLGQTIDVVNNTDSILDYARDMQQKHGGTYVVWLGPFAFVVLCDPRDVEIVMNNTATLSKTMLYKVGEFFVGYSLLNARRNDWKRFHKIMSPAFRNVTLQTFLPVFNKKSRVLINILKNHSNGQSFSVLKYMMMCTLDMVTETSLGMSMDILKNNRTELVETLKKAEEAVYRAMIRPWCWSKTLMKTTALYKASVEGSQIIRDFADTIVKGNLLLCRNNDDDIRFRREKFEEDENMETKRMGFLDHVVSCMQTDSNILTKTELIDNTIVVILAGLDTAAPVISAALMLLGLHQDVQKRVVEELERIFGDDLHRDVTNEDLTQMVYLEQVIKETLRLYPPLPLLCRAVEEEVDITGYTLPAGSIVMLSPFLTQRDAAYFPDPDKFDPDRFSRENSVGHHPYSFFPFLAGRRMCIGKKYAYLQMKTILSAVLRHYEVLPCGSREDMEKVQFRLTLHNVTGYKIKFVARR